MKKSFFLKYFTFIFVFFILFNHAFLVEAANTKKIPKNIILFIGDGMGAGHINAAKVTKGALHLERFKTVGLLTTHPADSFLGSTEAGTTALATGFNTRYSYISLSPLKIPLKTVLEYAEEKNKSTGIVVTSRVTDATPACFVSHITTRTRENEIAEDLVASGVDVLFGGGLAFFLPSSNVKSARKDERDLVGELRRVYPVITTPEEFYKLGTPKGAFGLLDLKTLPQVSERSVSLPEMTKKAINILATNKNGFFLMVEGSQIDWAAHRGDTEWIIEEMIDFDNAIGAGLDFAQNNGDTLIVVTSDHETGGYSIVGGSIKGHVVTKSITATGGHTANMVPLFAYGPGSEVFGGIHQNIIVGRNLIEYVRIWKSSD